MTLLEEVLLYDEYEDLGGYSATTFNKPTYQYYMQKKYGKIDPTPEERVASQIGTGFHHLAEKSLKHEVDNFVVRLEKTLTHKLNDKFLITGTPDVIHLDNGTVEDWKVKGPYQFQKAFRGEIQDLITQLSIYRWLDWKVNAVLLEDVGKAHVVCAGWQKNSMRIQKAYKEQYPNIEHYPKYMTVDVPLLSIEDTETMMLKWIERYEMQEVHQNIDCDTKWQCDYCDAKCVHNPKYKGE